MKLDEQTIFSTLLYKGKIINLRKKIIVQADGKASEREIVEHPGGVAIVAITNNAEIILVEQYRSPIEKAILEIPAGKLEFGEKPQLAARRELREETGYDCHELRFLGKYYLSPGYSTEIIHLFVAKDLFFSPLKPDEGENINLKLLKISEIRDFLYNLEPIDAKTAIALWKYLYREEKQDW